MDIDYQEGYSADHQSDIMGKRKLPEHRCLDMKWQDVKEITAWEIAWCIDQYEKVNISMQDLTEKRKSAIEKILKKISQENIKKEKEEEKLKQIKSIVCLKPLDETMCKLLDINFTATDTCVFEPEWFSNTKSAKEAIFLVTVLSNGIMHMIMEDGTRFKDRKFTKDLKAAKIATEKLIKTYERIGISAKQTMNALNTISHAQPQTVKQYLIKERDHWIDYFITLGNSKTNAIRIAKRITLLTEQGIPVTSRHQF